MFPAYLNENYTEADHEFHVHIYAIENRSSAYNPATIWKNAW